MHERVEDVLLLGGAGKNDEIVDVYEGKELVKRLVKVSPDDAQAIVDAARSGDLSLVEKLAITAEDEEFLSRQT